MIPVIKKMMNSSLLERIFAFQRAEKSAFQSGWERGYQDGKQLHDADCYRLTEIKEEKVEPIIRAPEEMINGYED